MSEADEIARFLAEHGVTRCPTAYAVETQAGVMTPPRGRVPNAARRPSAMFFKDQLRREIQQRLDKQKKASA